LADEENGIGEDMKGTDMSKLTPDQVVVYYLSVSSLSEAIESEGDLPMTKNVAILTSPKWRRLLTILEESLIRHSPIPSS